MDVANVMGSRPDGWWRDRAGAAVRLHAEIAALAASNRAVLPGDAALPGLPGRTAPPGPPGQTVPPEWVMVLEGAASAAASRIEAPESGRVRVVRARGSGDDAIVALVRELPGRRFVVTADRELRERSATAGATVLGPSWLLALLRP